MDASIAGVIRRFRHSVWLAAAVRFDFSKKKGGAGQRVLDAIAKLTASSELFDARASISFG